MQRPEFIGDFSALASRQKIFGAVRLAEQEGCELTIRFPLPRSPGATLAHTRTVKFDAPLSVKPVSSGSQGFIDSAIHSETSWAADTNAASRWWIYRLVDYCSNGRSWPRWSSPRLSISEI